MKNIVTFLILGCFVLTLTASAMQPVTPESILLNEQSMAHVVGGDFWCSFGFYSWGVWTGVAFGLALTGVGAIAAGVIISTIAFAGDQAIC